MPYFLCQVPLRTGKTLTLEGVEAEHIIKSRRIRQGERFALQDPAGLRCLAELLNSESRRATVRVGEHLPVPPPPPVAVTLLQAAIKEKAAEWVIQKGTELGVAAIHFFPSLNTALPSREASPAIAARWERIAWEACKQCDRQFPPEIGTLPGLEAALAQGKPGGAAWLLHPSAEPAGREAFAGEAGQAVPRTARVLVGPEGGFTPEEAVRAETAGFRPVKLGENLLRAETAALAACSLILFGG